MWATKISFDGTKENVLARYALKNNVRILIFPLSWVREKNKMIVNITGVIYGDKNDKKNFIRDWKKCRDNVLLDIDLNGDFFVGVVREHGDSKVIYNRNIVFTQPLLIDEHGGETIVVNSFEKKYLSEFIETMDSYHSVKVHYIRREKIKNISFRAEALDLTDKQKDAIDLAIRYGYYKFPRKISVKELALRSGLSFTAFHFHLRRAEEKLMPFFFMQ